MPINGINQNGTARPILFTAARRYSDDSNERAASARPHDQVEVSDRMQELLRIRKLVDAQPDVRLHLVNRLAKAIDQGTYNVKGEQIAEAIIEKHMIDLEG
jgi:negative regulator of flagellin synthesis FlgM